MKFIPRIPSSLKQRKNYTLGNIYNFILTIIVGVIVALVALIIILVIPRGLKSWWQKRKTEAKEKS